MRTRDTAYTQTAEFKSAIQRGMEGKKCGGDMYLRWLDKYGKQGADDRRDAYRLRRKGLNAGALNPMFGKPAPQGSGNGWSGWYQGFYFRSLRELSFITEIIEPQSLAWKTAESQSLTISYVDPMGRSRTYRADFVVGGNRLIECKPRKLWRTPSVLAKTKAAVAFCSTRGWIYRLVDPPLIPFEKLEGMHASGAVVFLAKYEEKFEQWKNLRP